MYAYSTSCGVCVHISRDVGNMLLSFVAQLCEIVEEVNVCFTQFRLSKFYEVVTIECGHMNFLIILPSALMFPFFGLCVWVGWRLPACMFVFVRVCVCVVMCVCVGVRLCVCVGVWLCGWVCFVHF